MEKRLLAKMIKLNRSRSTFCYDLISFGIINYDCLSFEFFVLIPLYLLVL